ncbi:MAG: hypothetical protein E7192_01860 [Erysipelotrichaceae bacterium]|nr:hypothetical protein [Erysipelotrichaceae bacterium]
MFIYPENLSQKPKLWLWHLKDIALIGIFGMISIFLYMELHFLVPGAIVITYAIMTVRFDDVSILDFIVYALKFFVLSQQEFTWRLEEYD